jgi:biopolymer transport protein ExbD
MSSGEHEFDYINVIPLVDVMLVLLTIVLTTSTMIASGAISLQLPLASATSEKIQTPKIVEIDENRNVYYSAKLVNLQELKIILDKEDRSVPILIKADKRLALQAFVDILYLIIQLEYSKISLQTEIHQ